ncbi:MAG: HAD family hydrolase [Candidatus Shapirobacteria bacterium]
MEEKLILFDWDDTLFSKEKFIKNLSHNLADVYGVCDEEMLETKKVYIDSLDRSGDFRIDDFVTYLEQKFDKKIDLNDFTSDRFGIYSKSLFPETIPVLNHLKEEFKLGVYSQGFDDFQKTKIESSGTEKFFDKNSVYIDRNKLHSDFIKKIPDGVTIIDDKRKVVEELKTHGRFNIIWINRITNEEINGIKTIRNLNELTDLVKIRAV